MIRIYLDFDGVLADSAVECINSSFDVWSYLRNDFDKVAGTKKQEVKSLMIEYGIKNRYLVTPPEHYYCLLDVIFEEFLNNTLDFSSHHIREVFSRKTELIDLQSLSEFKDQFFILRSNKLLNKSNKEWVEENPPMPFTSKFLRLLEDKDKELYIISRKNYEAISKWCLGMNLSIKEIYGNEELTLYQDNKYSLIKLLQEKSQFPSSLFIDDTLSEINNFNWKDISVTTMQAGWGYNDLSDNSQSILKRIREISDDLHN